MAYYWESDEDYDKRQAYADGVAPDDELESEVVEEIQNYYECSYSEACYKMRELNEEQMEVFLFLRWWGFSFDEAMDYCYESEVLSYDKKGQVESVKVMTMLGEQILTK